jgi:hypothetical protein
VPWLDLLFALADRASFSPALAMCNGRNALGGCRMDERCAAMISWHRARPGYGQR